MYKQPGEAMPNASVLEKLARAANAEPWDPLPGMIKRQCPKCRYWFASTAETGLCPDCGEKQPRGRRRPA
jgi:rubrerythrin